MTRMHVGILTLALSVCTAAAQTQTKYAGVIVGDDVYVRGGASQDHYPLMKLTRGTKVEVVGRTGVWLQIVPPAKAFSLVSRRYVQADGMTGTVTGDRVNVRAGSFEYPSRWSTIQGRLNAGDKVRIVGQTEDFFKIAPPPGVVVYVSAAYVKRPDAAVATQPAPRAKPEATTKPSPTPPTTRPEKPVPSVQSKLTAAVEAFKAAEKALLAESAKPMDQRDLAKLEKMYKAIEAADDTPLQAKIAYRLKYLQAVAQRRAGAARVRELAGQAVAQRKTLAARQAELNAVTSAGRKSEVFTVTGRLIRSRLYVGDGVAPQRYRVTDDADGRTLLYAQAGDTVNLDSLNGWKVNLAGRKTYSPTLKTYVLTVQAVEKVPGGEPAKAPKALPETPARIDSAGEPYPRPWPKPATPVVEPTPAVKAPTTQPVAEAAPAAPVTPATGLPMNPATQPAKTDIDPEEYK